jgi:hypothetical protein
VLLDRERLLVNELTTGGKEYDVAEMTERLVKIPMALEVCSSVEIELEAPTDDNDGNEYGGGVD